MRRWVSAGAYPPRRPVRLRHAAPTGRNAVRARVRFGCTHRKLQHRLPTPACTTCPAASPPRFPSGAGWGGSPAEGSAGEDPRPGGAFACLSSPPAPQRDGVTQYRPRQKNPAMFRFPGLRKCRESFTAAVSFFLSNTDPLRWALCSFWTVSPARGQAGEAYTQKEVSRWRGNPFRRKASAPPEGEPET